jgi:hypothetical protein
VRVGKRTENTVKRTAKWQRSGSGSLPSHDDASASMVDGRDRALE